MAAAPISRLKKRAEFLAAAKGRKAGAHGLRLQGRRRASAEDAGEGLRLGFTCSKRVGNAVERNRARRRLKAVASEVAPRYGVAGCDYVLIGRPETIDRPYPMLLDDARRAFKAVASKLEGERR